MAVEMDRLVSIALVLRRIARRVVPLFAVTLLAAAVVVDARSRPHLAVSIALAAITLVVAVQRAVARSRLRKPDGWRDATLGMLVVLGAFEAVCYLDQSL